MKNNDKRSYLSAALFFSFMAIPLQASEKTAPELYTKVSKLNEGFSLVFDEGNPAGHLILRQLQPIQLTPDSSEREKALAVYLNKIFIIVKGIIDKKLGVAGFLLELRKSCNLEDVFVKALEQLHEIHREALAANQSVRAQKTQELINYLFTLQSKWKATMTKSNAGRLLLNLTNSMR
jgi:hypothetical protein